MKIFQKTRTIFNKTGLKISSEIDQKLNLNQQWKAIIVFNVIVVLWEGGMISKQISPYPIIRITFHTGWILIYKKKVCWEFPNQVGIQMPSLHLTRVKWSVLLQNSKDTNDRAI